MTGWKAVEMSLPAGEKDFVAIVDCYEGEVFYKFFVDGVWKHDEGQECVRREGNSDDRAWNVQRVQKSDLDVFRALACDSFTLKKNR